MIYFYIFLILLMTASASAFLCAMLVSVGVNAPALRRLCFAVGTVALVQGLLFWMGLQVDGWGNLILVQFLSPIGLLLLPFLRWLKRDRLAVIVAVSFSTLVVMGLSTYFRKKNEAVERMRQRTAFKELSVQIQCYEFSSRRSLVARETQF